MPTSPTHTYSINGLIPAYNPDEAKTMPVKLAANKDFVKGQVLGEKIGTNEKQTITVSGDPTGGEFDLTFKGQTATIPYNAHAEEVQALLEALSSIGKGNVIVTGGQLPGDVLTVEFVGKLGASNQDQMTKGDVSLTGGTSPDVAIATTQAGAAGTPGEYDVYNPAATNGTQVAKGILQYDCQTDANNKVTLSPDTAQSGGEHLEKLPAAPMFISGTFKTEDLTGLDQLAVNQLGRIFQGTIADGLLRLG